MPSPIEEFEDAFVWVKQRVVAISAFSGAKEFGNGEFEVDADDLRLAYSFTWSTGGGKAYMINQIAEFSNFLCYLNALFKRVEQYSSGEVLQGATAKYHDSTEFLKKSLKAVKDALDERCDVRPSRGETKGGKPKKISPFVAPVPSGTLIDQFDDAFNRIRDYVVGIYTETGAENFGSGHFDVGEIELKERYSIAWEKGGKNVMIDQIEDLSTALCGIAVIFKRVQQYYKEKVDVLKKATEMFNDSDRFLEKSLEIVKDVLNKRCDTRAWQEKKRLEKSKKV